MGDHLFISYATEDFALAEWLTLKLTAAGYKVWCDRFQLLGGERFPRDIDRAIKNDTFRLLTLISKASLEKDNPTKERTLALSIARERKVDFIIPLKVEPLSATDLNWMMSDITYIPFDNGWAHGLAQLLKKLDSINAPKSLIGGSKVAADSVLQEDVTITHTEILHTNVIEVLQIPDVIHRFDVRRRVSPADEDVINSTWPVYIIDDSTYLSFCSPPPDLQGKLNIIKAGGAVCRDAEKIDGVSGLNIVSNLLSKSIKIKCLQKGLKSQDDARLLYFPNGLIENNRLKFISYDGNKTHVLAVGQRKKSGAKYRYHLAPTFEVRRNLIGKFSILLKIRIMITDTNGEMLPPRQALSRRKHLCKNWWNDQWFKRAVAVMYYLADGQKVLQFGSEEERVALSSKFANYQVGFGIDEGLLSHKRTEEEIVFLEEADEDESADEKSSEVSLDE
ncbi:MAG TPA: toll/interleukin-1 receptor domain-containing protein [Candidatus Nanoarchaeia archaeon]|nr:toll/interleukin-1 receptor domain-containing protein [Candidatus Nanoarchaeia archaeon]